MAFSPPRPTTRERILVFGAWNTGKSFTWLSIARYCQDHGNRSTFYCLDTDNAIERMLEEQFADLRNVDLARGYEWPDYTRWLEAIKEKAGTGDWVIADMICNAWDAVQRYFIKEIYGKDPGEFFLEIRKASKSPKDALATIAREQMWPTINKVYADWINPLIFQIPAHLFAAAKVTQVSDFDDKAVRSLFRSGVRPAGQKALGHQFHTVLLFVNPKQDDYRATTIKDRGGRKPFNGDPLKSFPVQYLMARAGWRNSD